MEMHKTITQIFTAKNTVCGRPVEGRGPRRVTVVTESYVVLLGLLHHDGRLLGRLQLLEQGFLDVLHGVPRVWRGGETRNLIISAPPHPPPPADRTG